ncbi:MAG TPA: amidase family protein [Solirubrobacterales bacterium]
MSRKIPPSELKAWAALHGYDLPSPTLHEFTRLADEVLQTVGELDSIKDPWPASNEKDRTVELRDNCSDDPLNAVLRWCSGVSRKGATGPLTGKRVGLKDTISVAGLPLTGGTKLLEGFVPSRDSSVVDRILDAGGEIVALLNMDYLGFAAGGDSSSYGPTRCPYDITRTAGGSSSGSAAALHYPEIDVTLGCDQGGSIRIPAAWCGVIGLKPTHGLVPYTGILGIDQLIDHVGPLGRTVFDIAQMLEVIAGADGHDPRQVGAPGPGRYVEAASIPKDSLEGARIGVLAEGFGQGAGVDATVADRVRRVTGTLAQLGAHVVEVSVAEHLHAGPIAYAIYMEGMAALMSAGGNGYQWRGRYWPELASFMATAIPERSEDLSDQLKLVLACGSYLQSQTRGAAYARAVNRQPVLTAAYDRALSSVDYLVMPTCPSLPYPIDPTLSIYERVKRGWGVLANTGQFNLTGHPAISLPLAEVDGLPVGVMFVSRMYAEEALLDLAGTLENLLGWVPSGPLGPQL